VFRDGSAKTFSAVWEQDGSTIEIRGTARDLHDFTSTLSLFHQVDLDTWLAAMPASVVTPSSRADVVDQMLADMPLPPRFNLARLHIGPLRDRYQLGAQVSAAVGCGWIDEWLSAKPDGDDARLQKPLTRWRLPAAGQSSRR
jgi:hypothetical protein